MGTLSLLKTGTLFLLFLAVVCAALPAFAADHVYTMQQVIDYALAHNGDLNALREEKGIRNAAMVKAGLQANPVLDVEAGSGAISGSSENSIALGLSQEFSLSGKRAKRLSVAEYEMEIYRWQLADRERLLREEVKTAFYSALLAGQRLILAERFMMLNRQLLDVAEERLAAGDIPELERNLVKVELARSEGVMIDLVKGQLQSQTRLWMLAGPGVDSQRAVSGSLGSGTPIQKSLSDLKLLAREKRPDIKMLEAEKGKGDAEILLARADETPNITAGLVVRRDKTAMEIGGVEGTDTAYSIGVKLSMPIPLFDRNQAGLQEASARRSSSERRLAAAGRNAELEVETAYASYRNSEQILSLYSKGIIPQLEENLQLTQEAYRLGEVGILAVIQEQKKYFEVSEGYLAAMHGQLTALARLEATAATELSGGSQ